MGAWYRDEESAEEMQGRWRGGEKRRVAMSRWERSRARRRVQIRCTERGDRIPLSRRCREVMNGVRSATEQVE